ncbi:hypothetical protein [Gynuella sunshinyii]|uniref:Uncharacterized protein n=1 Tax=Gynuella sunshinyii YC6258 TaxID=1445510 RepID=A0A0C5UZY9_9GAMM|nr:hypothetical protein [Gynuella sunshinyii]AJQ92875.1 hypothetical Protein YC6258_00825 [Gynuella sunshinyii YC6258]
MAFNAEQRRWKILWYSVGAAVGWVVAYLAVVLPSGYYDKLWPLGFALVAAVLTRFMPKSSGRKAGVFRYLWLIVAAFIWVLIGLMLFLPK